MNAKYQTNLLPRESNLRLANLISQEIEVMTFAKERYDLAFPTHAKDLTRNQMWAIARNKVIHELCIPECVFDESLNGTIR